MKRLSVHFTVLGLLTLSFGSLHAQNREIGGNSLALDDNHGHIVDITIPVMTGPGPYSWTLPITPGGSSLSLPTPTTAGSMLYSNGSTAWLENTNVTATNLGVLSVAGAYQIGGSTVLTNAGTQNIFVGVGAGSGNGSGNGNTAVGYNASVGTGKLGATAIGYFATANGNNTTALGEGANANFIGATALGVASALAPNAIAIGYGATANGASAIAIGFSTTANDNNSIAIGNNIDLFGSNLIQLGNASVTQVITYGGIRAAGAITSLTAAGGLVLGAGAIATTTTLTSTATSARAISFPDASGTLAVSGGGATEQATPATPPATGSTSGVQMGLAGTITPSSSGKVMLIISGRILNTNTGSGGNVSISYGTGAAPAFGDLPTGTTVGNALFFTEPNALYSIPFTNNAVITGLTVGTAYWIDLQVSTVSGGQVLVGSLSISAMEMP